MLYLIHVVLAIFLVYYFSCLVFFLSNQIFFADSLCLPAFAQMKYFLMPLYVFFLLANFSVKSKISLDSIFLCRYFVFDILSAFLHSCWLYFLSNIRQVFLDLEEKVSQRTQMAIRTFSLEAPDGHWSWICDGKFKEYK